MKITTFKELIHPAKFIFADSAPNELAEVHMRVPEKTVVVDYGVFIEKNSREKKREQIRNATNCRNGIDVFVDPDRKVIELLGL